MKVAIERNAHPPAFAAFFPPCKTDFGFDPAVQSAIESEWYGVTINDAGRAFAHIVAPKPIPGTPWRDVEPFMGYTGFLTTSHDPAFLAAALAAYSDACRSLGIVAELVRFNPLLANHLPYLDRPELEVVAAKPIVVVTCERDEQSQLAHFHKYRRRDVRRALNELDGRLLDKTREMDLFRELYERSLDRLGAGPHWRFGDRFYAQVARCQDFEIQSVWSGNELAAAVLIGAGRLAWHYLLLGSAEDHARGVGEWLVYQTARRAAESGARHLILGGGVTAAPDDGILLFKSKFARQLTTFFIGKMVHDSEPFETLSRAAVVSRPELAESSYFLKHRLVEQ